MPLPVPPRSGARSARNLLCCFLAVAVPAALLPPVFPATLPAARIPLWWLLIALAGGLAVLLVRRPRTSRRALLGIGWALVISTVLQGFLVGDLVAMFATWLAVPALAQLAGQLRPRPRKALVAAHVIAAACWVGIALTVSAMAVVALTSSDIETSRVTYGLMATFDMTLLPWANFATILTGLALGITTGWGLIRYWWVIAKIAIAVGILFMAFGFLHDALELAREQTAHLAETGGVAAQSSAAPWVVFWGFTGSLLSLAGATLLSLYKPGGKTRRGRRSAPRTPAPARATVTEIRTVATGTAALTLKADGTAALANWAPGAHIDVVLPSGRVRQYSLCGDPAGTGSYRIAVLAEPEGRGGSTEIHGLQPGAKVGIRGPRNHFPLVEAPAYLFVAGGIGITPFLPMIDQLGEAPWRLVYRGRSLPTMAFAATLADRFPDRVTVLPADSHPRPDLDTLLRTAAEGTAVYCCGPEELLTAMETAAARHPHTTLHTERFAASNRAEHAENTAFHAELRRSGVTVAVPAHRTLLSAIQEVDPTVDMSCTDGVCGSCATRVLAGIPDHRDDVLRAAERERTDIIYPCVSRARGARIVLDV